MNSLFGICVSVLLAIGTAQPSNHPQYGYPDALASSSEVVQQKHFWNSASVYPTHHEYPGEVQQNHDWNSAPVYPTHNLYPAEVQRNHEWNSAPVYSSHEAYPVKVQQKHDWNLAPHSYSTHQEYARGSSETQQIHDWNPAPHSYSTHPEYPRISAQVQQKHTLNAAPQSYPSHHEYPGHQLHHIPGSAHMPSYTVPVKHYPSQPYPVHSSQAVSLANSGPTPFNTTPDDMPRTKTVYIPMAASGAEYSMPVADHDTRNVKVIHNTKDEIVQKADMAKIRAAEGHDDDDLQKKLISSKPKEVRTSEPKEVRNSKPKVDGTSKPNSKDTIPCPKHHYHNQALPIDIAPIPVSLIKRIVAARKTKAKAVVATSSGKVLANVASSTTKNTGKPRPQNNEPVELLLDHELIAKDIENNSEALHHEATIQDEKDNTQVDVTKIIENEDVIKSEEIIHKANKNIPINHYDQNDNTDDCTHNDHHVTSAQHHKASSPDKTEMTEVNETKTTEKTDATKTEFIIDSVNKYVPIDGFDQNDYDKSNSSHDKASLVGKNDNTDDSKDANCDVTRATHHETTSPDKIEKTKVDVTKTTEEEDVTKTEVIIDKANKTVPKYFDQDDSDVKKAEHNKNNPQHTPYALRETEEDNAETKTEEQKDKTKAVVIIDEGKQNGSDDYDQESNEAAFHKTPSKHDKKNDNDNYDDIDVTKTRNKENIVSKTKEKQDVIINSVNKNVPIDDYYQNDYDKSNSLQNEATLEGKNDNTDRATHHKTTSPDEIKKSKVDVTKTTEEEDVTKTEVIDKANKNVLKYFDQDDFYVKKAHHKKNNPQHTLYTLRETEEDNSETKSDEQKDETKALVILIEGKQNGSDDYDQENHEAPFHKTPSQHDNRNDNDDHDDVTKTRSEKKTVSKTTEKKDVTKAEVIVDEAKENVHEDNYEQDSTYLTTDLNNENPNFGAAKPKYDQTKSIDVAIPITSEEVEQILEEAEKETPLTPIGFLFSLISNVLKGRDNVRQMFNEPKVKSFVQNVIPLFPIVNDDKK